MNSILKFGLPFLLVEAARHHLFNDPQESEEEVQPAPSTDSTPTSSSGSTPASSPLPGDIPPSLAANIQQILAPVQKELEDSEDEEDLDDLPIFTTVITHLDLTRPTPRPHKSSTHC